MATPQDADAVAEIYLPYVRDTAISFEATPPDAEEMRSRITTTLAHLPWLVVTDDERVKGFAYASPHRAREAYRWSVDVSLYLDESIHRRGRGRRLYTALINVLVAQGYINAYAGIALPNPASVGLHEALGFTPVGVFSGVGFKHETWWDVGWWHRRLVDPPPAPADPLPWSRLSDQALGAALAADTR
ncbi:acetyltransferase [Mycobacterium colombiense]|uniref:arsinothricin resistance N-acetyltransferase ArsN1 family B n=1 Tax=Mycobacterium colombiense TaxID=339268 RepID=UPI00096C1FB3|nr:arsinothricin resistance N-acetyltransferase ArsN1 family B [Mycobacterium colombiense]OMB91080.1 acetyltransferase [Mycobacterium colombiense]OMC25457.1 acetyltransferase [Mycobacterium colombiense]OMC27510.1 acetyltransferase [Mycobacterium colombiense]